MMVRRWLVGFILLFLMWMMFSGCSPQKRLNGLIRRQEKLIRIYPDLVKKRDTIFTMDTIIKSKEVVKFKPIYIGSNTTDTIWKDKTRIVYSVVHDSVHFDVLCPPDTIYKESAIITNVITKEVRKMNGFQKFFFWSGVICCIIVATYTGIKIYKPF